MWFNVPFVTCLLYTSCVFWTLLYFLSRLKQKYHYYKLTRGKKERLSVFVFNRIVSLQTPVQWWVFLCNRLLFLHISPIYCIVVVFWLVFSFHSSQVVDERDHTITLKLQCMKSYIVCPSLKTWQWLVDIQSTLS